VEYAVKKLVECSELLRTPQSYR